MEKLIEKLKSKAKKVLGIGVWILIVLLSFSIVKNISRVNQIRIAVQAEKDKVTKMNEQNSELETQIAETQGGDFIEKQIRDKLGLVKVGEAIVVLPDADILRKLAPQVPVEADALPDPTWKKWEKLFTP